ncbi:alanine racemase [Muricauda sp. 2012CJ35-5]|uniref:Alanine racemase n=1 Tax=Flagellimonas spongiicola TaxID=2942208 RepID=A0ABT0PQ35_9FLAO|nr:alanine racemase [Allomuricauda spongiicola]MCL6273495.1 alanine racemase [Allomuricauda spongiicola]
MKSRRNFLRNSTFGIIGAGLSSFKAFENEAEDIKPILNKASNPWLEISKKAYLSNVESIYKFSGNTPVLAVLKNNAYGIGDIQVATILDESPFLSGIALVKDTRCLALRKHGVKKPILLMGDFDLGLGSELVANNITLSAFSHESCRKIKELASKTQHRVSVELYFDTGLGRMGMPYQNNLDWVADLASIPNVKIEGLFSTLTTPTDFAKEQMERFNGLISKLNEKGIKPNRQHMAPSLSLMELPQSHFNAVRPGILVHGSYPLGGMDFKDKMPLQPTYRLKAPVIRIEKLKKGDTIGFSRFYKVEKDEWIATLPVGWADGYYSGAENGAKVLLNNKLFKVVNVNASHCNLSIGNEKLVDVGDVATLIGPDHEEITPEGFSRAASGHNYLQIQYKESLPKSVVNDF